MTKIWLDDQINDPHTPDRWVPMGYVGAATAREACRLIARGDVTHVDFDHDLGDQTLGSGYTVARFIEKGAALGTIKPLTWTIHSANPVGRGNIAAAMASAERFWSRLTRGPQEK